jgi:preprotein translocase subunit SecG
MTTFLTIVHVFVCLFLVGVVLLQSGRAGGMGVLSGAASQTVFGGRGAGGFLAKATAVCATLFMLTSASLAYTSTSGRDSLARGAAASNAATGRDGGASDAAVVDAAPTPAVAADAAAAPATPEAPAAPTPAAAPEATDAAAAH